MADSQGCAVEVTRIFLLPEAGRSCPDQGDLVPQFGTGRNYAADLIACCGLPVRALPRATLIG